MSFPSSGFSCCNSHFGNTNQQGLDTIHPGSFKILQILKCHFHNVMNEGNPRLAAKRVWVSPSCLPLLLASPSRFQSADEIISQKRIISSAVNESQPSAAMTAASPEKKQLLLAGTKACIKWETTPCVTLTRPSQSSAAQTASCTTSQQLQHHQLWGK